MLVAGYFVRALCGPRLDPTAHFALFVLKPFFVERIGWLHIVVTVDQHGRQIGRFDALAVDDGVAFRRKDLGLESGFQTADILVLSEQDILGERLIRNRRKRKASDALTEASSLAAGDLVVHVDHGVGRYMGLEVVTALGFNFKKGRLDVAEFWPPLCGHKLQ